MAALIYVVRLIVSSSSSDNVLDYLAFTYTIITVFGCIFAMGTVHSLIPNSHEACLPSGFIAINSFAQRLRESLKKTKRMIVSPSTSVKNLRIEKEALSRKLNERESTIPRAIHFIR